MHDPAAAFLGHMFRGRRLPEPKQRDDLAAEALLVELERSLTLAVEVEIRDHLHGTLPSWSGSGPAWLRLQ